MEIFIIIFNIFSLPFITNFTDPIQTNRWKNLVKKVVIHYIATYGLKEVSEWNFESWNEPDHGKNR